MAVIRRFRPVLMGDPRHPAAVFYLKERPDGKAVLRDREAPWLLETSLEAATLETRGRLDRVFAIIQP